MAGDTLLKDAMTAAMAASSPDRAVGGMGGAGTTGGAMGGASDHLLLFRFFPVVNTGAATADDDGDCA